MDGRQAAGDTAVDTSGGAHGRAGAGGVALPPPPPPPPSTPAAPAVDLPSWILPDRVTGSRVGYADAVSEVPRQPGEPSREYRLRYRSPLRWLTGRTGLTVAAVVLIELLGGAVGAGYELAGPHQLLARAFCVAFAVSAIVPMLLVRVDHAIAAVVATPLCYGVLVVVTSLFSMTGSGSALQRLVEEAAVQALYSAPGLFAAVVGTGLVAAVKLASGRRHRRRRQLAARLERIGIPR